MRRTIEGRLSRKDVSQNRANRCREKRIGLGGVASFVSGWWIETRIDALGGYNCSGVRRGSVSILIKGKRVFSLMRITGVEKGGSGRLKDATTHLFAGGYVFARLVTSLGMEVVY